MKMNKLQKSINTSLLVIVIFIIITLIVSFFNTNFLLLLIPISFAFLALILFDILEYVIDKIIQ
jgi:hypothetical protein